ncbi:MAG: RMD1 family protein [Verrucomicrobia bacterium]|nr:RMD1 family protein [Verrucomicrobiota bacterium]MBS0646181.1 RMD1 family protein [Verrucomicrobiota bacterium]
MRCSAYCTAASYNLAKLFDTLKKLYATTLYRDTVHIAISDQQDVFFFSYGVALFWSVPEEEEAHILQLIKPVESEPLNPIEQDWFDFSYAEIAQIKRDEILLSDKEVLTKLAVSYGIAQSTKLTSFENRIDRTIAKTSQLPRDLALKGKIPLTRKQISKKIGELFLDRSSVNLHSDILDEPEFFWEYPEHHLLYRNTIKCFDLAPRIEVLNTRLNTLGDLWDILSTQLNHQHSSTLEWTIIWLIVIEVVLALLRDLFHLI